MSRSGTPDRHGRVSPLTTGPRSLPRRIVSILAFGLVVGITGSVFAIAVVDSIIWLGRRLVDLDAATASSVHVVFLLGPVLGGLVVALLLRFKSDRRATGVADVIHGVQAREGHVTWRDGFINTVASVVGIGSGASAGQYGPLTIMGASLGASLGRWFRYDPGLGVGCGVAAAISTAFSAPIAAILFAHEVILRHYSLRAFAPITVASSTGFFIENFLLGRPPLFEVVAERSLFAPEFLAFVAIGLGGALVAVVYMRAIIHFTAVATRSRIPAWLRPAVAGLGVGLLAQWVPEVLGLGQDVLAQTIAGYDRGMLAMALILGAKIVATALCIGFGFAGGVFSPALLIGVLTGALLGHGAGLVLGDMASGPAFYAVCGMAAVASPVIGGPLTAILIVFELTRNYELTTAVMISVVFSNVVAYRLFGRSLFDRQLALDGCDLSLGRDKLVLQRTSISAHVTTDAVIVSGEDPLATARNAMIVAKRQECYVLDELSRYLGKLRLFDILQLEQRMDLATEPAASHADTDHLSFRHHQSVWDALEEMHDFVGESIPIVDQRGYFIGIVYESTLVTAYLRAISKIRAEEHAA